MENDDNLRRRVCNAAEHLATSGDPLTARVRDAFVHQLAPILIGDYRHTGTRVLAEEIHDLAPADDDWHKTSPETARHIADRIVALDRLHRPLDHHER